MLLMVLGAALVIRVIAVSSRAMITGDELAYVRMAENLAAGSGLDDLTAGSVNYTALLPVFIALPGLLLGDYIAAAFATGVFFSVLLLVPTFFLGRQFFNARVGLMAAAMAAVMPLMVDYGSRVYSENVYIFFLLWALFFGWRLLTLCRGRDGALAGLCLGLAYLANPGAVHYLGILTLLALAADPARRAGRRLFKPLACFLLLFAVCAAPYVFFLHGQTGQWTFSGKKAANYHSTAMGLSVNSLEWEKWAMTLNEDGDGLIVDTVQETMNPIRDLFTEPVRTARVFAWQTYILYSQELQKTFPLWLLPLLGLGLFGVAWDRRRAAMNGYLALMMAPALLILTMYIHRRYFMPFLPIAILWTAAGWRQLELWGRQTVVCCLPERRQQSCSRMVPWLLAPVMLLPLLGLAVHNVRDVTYPLEFKRTGEWLAGEAGSGSLILSREYDSAFYAGGTHVLLPYASYEATTAYARQKGIDFLVIAAGDMVSWRPGLAPLLEDGAHPEWELVGVIDGGAPGEVLVFRPAGDAAGGGG